MTTLPHADLFTQQQRHLHANYSDDECFAINLTMHAIMVELSGLPMNLARETLRCLVETQVAFDAHDKAQNPSNTSL